MSRDASKPVVLVDGENVRRSGWPNLTREELGARCRAWGDANGREAIVFWEGAETADDAITRWTEENERPYWLATSDRELRERAGGRAERIVGGGAFLSEL